MKTISQVKKTVLSKRTRLAALRIDAGLTLRDLAQHAGISLATAQRAETGKAPDIRTALHLAKFYETSVEDLFHEFF